MAAAVRQPGIAARVMEMKAYLAELREHHAAGRELPAGRSHDARFMDLLVAMENDRDPSLRLSAQSIDYKGLSQGGAAAMQAVAGLARAAIAGMEHGRWHAVVSIDGHEVAVGAMHDAKHPGRMSLVAVDSVGGHLSAEEWKQVALILSDYMNRSLVKHGKRPEAKVWMTCLNTSVQKTNESGAIFALAAVRLMPKDKDVLALHARQLRGQAKLPHAAGGARVIKDNAMLGARFFKHMTSRQGMQDLLEKRPELENVVVSWKGRTLRQHQAEHLSWHEPPFGLPYEYSSSYEKRRLRMYERAIARLEVATWTQQAAAQLEGMKEYLHELRRAETGMVQPPAPRDAEFLTLLVGVANTLDPQLRLRAHSLDPARLAAGDMSVTDDLWQSFSEGVRSGAGWHATLDIGGHHAALSARHAPDDSSIVSLVVLDGAGSPLHLDDWEVLAELLCQRLHAEQAETDTDTDDDERFGKVWLTRLDVSAALPEASSALLALTAATELKDDEGVGDIHDGALAQAREYEDFSMAWEREPGDLVDDEAAVPEAELQQQRIELYQRAIGYYERSLVS
jgi:hypothetical protein